LARKILLADDSVTAQNMGRKILADAGYDVSTVNNGSAALKRIAELKPDLIVLDVYMPGYSGLEVCQRLKDAPETAHIPVLLTVGKLEPFKPEEARRVRADAHIVKPFEASELLTAITRLEDRMVPQADGSRFSTSVSGLERFEGSGRKTESDGEADTGWKSRLRFPAKKKKEEKEEAEAEDVAAAATYRDFRKGKGKNGASSAFAVKAPAPPGQEPGLVPDIPRDITPEELDALSALVAKRDGPIPETENITPLADKAVEVVAAKTEVKVPAAEAKKEEQRLEAETSTSMVEPAATIVDRTIVAEATAGGGKSAVEIPVEHLEPKSEGALAVDEAAQIEVHQSETKGPESKVEETTQLPEPPTAVPTVNTALMVQDPAPVDRTDEPIFASANAIEQIQEKIEAPPIEAAAKDAKTDLSEVIATSEAVALKSLESKPEESEPEESRSQQSKTEALKPEDAAQPVPVATNAPKPVEAEEPAPSDAELAEALRLLTPATGHADSSFSQSTIPSHGTLVAAGQLLAEEAARNAAGGPRWIAEPVALSLEEASISLEAEMFRTFATAPAIIPGREPAVGRITGVSAITAAVENRLAEAGLAYNSPSLAMHEASPNSENLNTEQSAVEAPAELAPVSNAASSSGREFIPEPIAARPTEVRKSESNRKESPAKVAEEEPAQEIAAATFADAVGKNEIEATAKEQVEPVNRTAAVATASVISVIEENQDPSSESGGQESMGRDTKGKSNWHQIRTAPANTAAGGNVVEAAKQAEYNAEEAPKAMAAAASAEGSSATDASTIASIVDSVMADLRPRIVEEIAKKLAGK
jgi:CheY-like chemotaxis protein